MPVAVEPPVEDNHNYPSYSVRSQVLNSLALTTAHTHCQCCRRPAKLSLTGTVFLPKGAG